MHYLDRAQLEFWREREKEERQLAAGMRGQIQIDHLRLADSYAVLITQMTGSDLETKPE